MWRDDEVRTADPDRREPSRGGTPRSTWLRASDDPREALTRDLDLPRGSERERVQVRGRTVELRGSEARTLATVGAFRAVPASDLRDQGDRPSDGRVRDLRHLREQGLIRTMPYLVGRTRTTLVTLTERGREVLEAGRRPHGREPAQAFYAGIVKPRELAHDARLYQAYLYAADRLASRGASVRRVLLDDELKREYQRFLQASNRGRPDSDGRSDRERQEIEHWAHLHHLPVEDGHMQFPDVRIEYEERDGRRAVEDVEVMTPHYRGAHAAAKVRAGFSRYHAVGARLGGGGRAGGRGGRPFDPGFAEELLQ